MSPLWLDIWTVVVYIVWIGSAVAFVANVTRWLCRPGRREEILAIVRLRGWAPFRTWTHAGRR